MNDIRTVPSAQLAERNQQILASRTAGQTLRQIADTHGISPERVRQILNNGCWGKTLTRLPGTEQLSPTTRALLIRLGYAHSEAVLAGLRTGKLRFGCVFGMGAARFAEIEAWARAK